MATFPNTLRQSSEKDCRAMGLYGKLNATDEQFVPILVNAQGALTTAGASVTTTSASGSLTNTLGTVVAATASVVTRVYAFSLTTTSATEVTVAFMSNTSRLWEVKLQAVSGSSVGANLASAVGSPLFSTGSNTALTLSCSSALNVHYSVSYYQE